MAERRVKKKKPKYRWLYNNIITFDEALERKEKKITSILIRTSMHIIF